jgi:hypothetical protein
MGGMGAAVGLAPACKVRTLFVIVRKACDHRMQASGAGRRVGIEQLRRRIPFRRYSLCGLKSTGCNSMTL